MSERTLTRRGKPLRVLLVEDHALIALDLEQMIADLGGEVAGITSSGESAEDLARRLRPDVVLMDVRLAGVIDGIDAAMAVAQVPGTALVFVTANTDQVTLDRIQRTGDFHVVPKPVMPTELVHAIRAACGLDAGARPCAAAAWQVSALPRRRRARCTPPDRDRG